MSKHTVRRKLSKIQGSHQRHQRRTASSKERRRLIRQWFAMWPYAAAVRKILLEKIAADAKPDRLPRSPWYMG
jgi:hypothetical protein